MYYNRVHNNYNLRSTIILVGCDATTGQVSKSPISIPEQLTTDYTFYNRVHSNYNIPIYDHILC